MNTTTKRIYADPAGPLELALLLPDTKVFLLYLVCRKYDVKKFALARLGFKEKDGSRELVQKVCPFCRGEESLELDVKSGLAVCRVCKKETDIVRLIRGDRCPYMVYALDYLLNQLLEGDYTEKKRLVEKLESLTKAIYESIIYPDTSGRTVLALMKDRSEFPLEGGGL
jgi:hypothetical protein